MARTAPKANAVTTAELVGRITDLCQKRLRIEPAPATVVATWVASTHVFDVFDCFPRLIVTGPSRRLAVAIIGSMCRRPIRADRYERTDLIRAIVRESPTVILDHDHPFANLAWTARAVNTVVEPGKPVGRYFCPLVLSDLDPKELDASIIVKVPGLEARLYPADPITGRRRCGHFGGRQPRPLPASSLDRIRS